MRDPRRLTISKTAPAGSGSAPYAVQTGAYTLTTPLNNFGLIASNDPSGAVGFRWDATPVAVDLGEIAAGGSTTLSYDTSVTSFIRNPGFLGDQAPIAYSGFGDPIGANAGSHGIHDPNFPLLQYDVLPTYDEMTNELTSGQFPGLYPGRISGHRHHPDLVFADHSAPDPPDSAVVLVAGRSRAGVLGADVCRHRPDRRDVAVADAAPGSLELGVTEPTATVPMPLAGGARRNRGVRRLG